jgi:hypothetical protein
MPHHDGGHGASAADAEPTDLTESPALERNASTGVLIALQGFSVPILPGPCLPRPQTPGRLGASAPPLELLPGTSQAREAVEAQEAAPTELPGIEEPVDPDEADSGAVQELMVPRGVAPEDNLLRFDPVPSQNELDLPGLREPGLVAEAVVEPRLERVAAEVAHDELSSRAAAYEAPHPSAIEQLKDPNDVREDRAVQGPCPLGGLEGVGERLVLRMARKELLELAGEVDPTVSRYRFRAAAGSTR